MSSRTAAPMMRAVKSALELARYDAASTATDNFLDALHEAGYEVVAVAHDKAVPVASVAQAYEYQRPIAPMMDFVS